ncbi:hypothetical protein DRO69_07105 [Candidatus Bathyarchaeota archaeon]|nr:MAG: hypothetical protein DRO69_07105 [Candidatus Bathyarchaeota archaeon]
MGWEVSSTVKRGYKPERIVNYIESLPEPRDIHADFERQYRIYVNNMKRAQDECGDDVLWINGASTAIKEEHIPQFCFTGTDICYSHGPMISPKVLDEICFPYVKYAFEPLKKAGIKIIWHSDGYITRIVNDSFPYA